MPILPHLPELWASSVDRGDDAVRAELFARLASAESVLSSYREALHRRLDRATAELVARYHEDPPQCLVALTLEPIAAAVPRLTRVSNDTDRPGPRLRRALDGIPTYKPGRPAAPRDGRAGVQAVVQREPVPAAAVGARGGRAASRRRSTATPTCSRPG